MYPARGGGGGLAWLVQKYVGLTVTDSPSSVRVGIGDMEPPLKLRTETKCPGGRPILRTSARTLESAEPITWSDLFYLFILLNLLIKTKTLDYYATNFQDHILKIYSCHTLSQEFIILSSFHLSHCIIT